VGVRLVRATTTPLQHWRSERRARRSERRPARFPCPPRDAAVTTHDRPAHEPAQSMIAFSVALGLVAFVLLLPALSDLLSVLRIATRRASPATGAGADKLPRFLFLVPAHNEELLLPACLESLQRMRYPRRRVDIIVVADNCTDRTADIARDTGVSCLVR